MYIKQSHKEIFLALIPITWPISSGWIVKAENVNIPWHCQKSATMFLQYFEKKTN